MVTRKLWISRYALSSGIEQIEMEQDEYDPRYWIALGDTHTRRSFGCTLGLDCHETRKQAIAAANKMRDRTIASLEKQLTKLRSLTFGE